MPEPRREGAKEETTMLSTETHQVQLLSNKGKELWLPQQGIWNVKSTHLLAEHSAVLCTNPQLIILHGISAKANHILTLCFCGKDVCSIRCTSSSKLRVLVKSQAFSMFSSSYQPFRFRPVVDFLIQTLNHWNWRQITSQHPCSSQQAGGSITYRHWSVSIMIVNACQLSKWALTGPSAKLFSMYHLISSL